MAIECDHVWIKNSDFFKDYQYVVLQRCVFKCEKCDTFKYEGSAIRLKQLVEYKFSDDRFFCRKCKSEIEKREKPQGV